MSMISNSDESGRILSIESIEHFSNGTDQVLRPKLQGNFRCALGHEKRLPYRPDRHLGQTHSLKQFKIPYSQPVPYVISAERCVNA